MTLTFRQLSRDELAHVRTIDRSEVTHNVYALENGVLVLKPEYHDLKGWPEGIVATTASLLECFERNGWCLGALYGEQLVAAAVLESRFIGAASDQLQLKFLHVSNAHRHQGLGGRLFAEARAEARARGARQMYVSAIPSENTIDFYQRQGCQLADQPDPELLAMEPEDIHLVCAT